MVEHDPLIGRQLGAYLVQHKLGEGGMARVYKAYHARLRRDVAIKVILAPNAGDGDFRARFEREAQLIASLEHPNIVAVYDFSDEGQLAYLVMQYVGGGTLRDQLRGGYPLAPDRAAHYALLMARALHHAHQRGIVHRDVKPQNMLVSAQDRSQLLLSDFGIARLFDNSQEITWASGSSSGSVGNGLTQADQIIGTLEYMAPEQIRRQAIDARTDVYALGVVLFQLLTGRVPFLSSTTMGLMYQHVHTPAPSVHELNPNVPQPLAQITARALQKAPSDRFQSAEAMAQALESVLSTTINTAPTTYTTLRRDATLPTYNHMPTLPSAPVYEPASFTNRTPAHTDPATGYPVYPATGTHSAYPPQSAARKSISAQMIAGIAILVIVLAVIVMRFQASPGDTGYTTNMVHTPTTAAPFVDTFATNSQDWVEGSIGGLTASVNGQYTLTTNARNETYFPYPARSGTLPQNFTLSTRMQQDTGTLDRYYGLALNLRYQQNAASSCYAFVVASNGTYMVLRYDSAGMSAISPTVLWQGNSSAIHGLHQSNELQVTDQHGTFTFKINGQQMLLKKGHTLTDTTYTGGQPGLMVTGPGAGYSVTRMQLAIP